MRTILRFNFQLLLTIVAGLFFQNSLGQVSISTHNTNITTALTGWNGTLPTGFTREGGGNYEGTTQKTTGGVYSIANAGFGYQPSSGVNSVDLTGTYRNNTGNTITSLQITYKAFVIHNRDSRRPNWTVTSSLGNVSSLNWTFSASNTVTNPANKTITLNNLNIAANATFSITFSSDRGTGSGSSPLIGVKDIVLKSIQEVTTGINTNPNSLSFGNTEIGSFSASRTVIVTGTELTAPISITTLSNFQVSNNNIDWDTFATLPSTGGTLYVRFAPFNLGGQSTSLTLNSTGTAVKYVFVEGTGIPATVPTITTSTASFGPFCNSQDNTFNVNFSKTGTFTATDFSVQLSDASGNFSATATNIIGTGTTSPISVTIPENTIVGNYRIRVLNENPLTFSNNNGSDIAIGEPAVAGTIYGSATFCSTTNTGTITLSDYVGTISHWQVSTSQDFSTGVTDLPTTAANLPFNNLNETHYIRAVLINGGCDSVNSDIATITINTTLTTPDFAQILAFCSGSTAPVLELTSPNGITGTWSPETVSNTENGTYVFTPDAGQCASEVTLTTTINEITAPDFAQIPAFCSGSTAPVLELTSPNGITGTWLPATVSNTENGTYVFTPDAGQCASEVTLTTTINEITAPDFAQIPAFCSGSTAPVLELTSPNGITGTWSPAIVSNTENGTYIFTPDAGQCASEVTLTTTINEITAPDFTQIPAFCSGSTAPVLELTSPNGITGTWSPAIVSNTENGTYIFTPDAGQCASEVTLNTTVTETLPPTGDATQDFLTNDTLEDFIVNGENIKWYDAQTDGNELQDSELIVSGTIYYVSQTLNGCESERLAITAGTDLKTDSFDLSQLKYYPNPTNNILNLEYSQAISSVKVYNLVGQQILVANPNTTSVKMDLSYLNSGTYFVNITSENNSKTIKVIKK